MHIYNETSLVKSCATRYFIVSRIDSDCPMGEGRREGIKKEDRTAGAERKTVQ